MKIGIVGLPNVGKSTLFNALTQAGALCENYPFTTLQPNVGIAAVPDTRLEKIAAIYQSKTMVPTSVEFVDIAGLVKGASQGEGLGNQFLSHIRQVDALAHVLRGFEDEHVAHVHGKVNPVEDSQVVQMELMLADLDIATKSLSRLEKLKKVHEAGVDKKYAVYERMMRQLESGIPLQTSQFTKEELTLISESGFLTLKPVLYVLNLDENTLQNAEILARQLREGLGTDVRVIGICAKVEDELNELQPEEAREFLRDLGLQERGLNLVIREGYQLLGLVTFFTTESSQAKAWTVLKGAKALEAAGKIHTDMERGFIRAEVIAYADLERLGSSHKVKEAGLLRLEGKDYVIQDGDIVLFRFSV